MISLRYISVNETVIPESRGRFVAQSIKSRDRNFRPGIPKNAVPGLAISH